MIKRHAKGTRNERKDIDHFISKGFVLVIRSIRTKWQAEDIGPFDSMFYLPPDPGNPPRIMAYVSSKSNGHYTPQHLHELNFWAKNIVGEGSIVQLRDHHDSYWKFSHVECKHENACKLKDKVWKAVPHGNTCPSCGRHLKICKQLVPAETRVIEFKTTNKEDDSNECTDRTDISGN